jgi:hypothetical protein
MEKKCNICKKDLSSSKLENYSAGKDLLLCAQCWGEEQEKYKDYSASHFNLVKRSGEVDGSSEAVVVWDYKN